MIATSLTRTGELYVQLESKPNCKPRFGGVYKDGVWTLQKRLDQIVRATNSVGVNHVVAMKLPFHTIRVVFASGRVLRASKGLLMSHGIVHQYAGWDEQIFLRIDEFEEEERAAKEAAKQRQPRIISYTLQDFIREHMAGKK